MTFLVLALLAALAIEVAAVIAMHRWHARETAYRVPPPATDPNEWGI